MVSSCSNQQERLSDMSDPPLSVSLKEGSYLVTVSALPPGLDPEFTLEQVAKSFHRSSRWLSDRIKRDNVEHTRHGNKITFTVAQVEKLRALDKVTPTAQPVTTGRGKTKS